jgi:hypothetical protein
VVGDFGLVAKNNAIYLAARTEALKERLVRSTAPSEIDNVVVFADKIPTEIKHKGLSAAVAIVARRIQRVVCKGEKKDAHAWTRIAAYYPERMVFRTSGLGCRYRASRRCERGGSGELCGR